MVFAQLYTLWVLAQNPPKSDFPGRELHLPSLLLSHPGACEGLGAEAPGDSQCSPVVQDETCRASDRQGDAQGSLGAVAFGQMRLS